MNNDKQRHTTSKITKEPNQKSRLGAASKPSLMLKAFFLFSDLAVLIAKTENKKGFSTPEKARISRLPG